MTTILIVEDDSKIAHAMSVRLKSLGYSVRVAADAPSALIQARKHSPDLVLLDISLPGGNGFTVAQNLEEHICDRRIPIIFVTASKQEELKKRASELGASAFLEKPFSARHLAEAIDHALMQTRGPMEVRKAQRC